jgi:endonuclease YncB( thermonuclease family)
MLRGAVIFACAFAAAILFAAPAAAQPTITDGDTIKQSGVIYRLFGIDAPELKQEYPDGWPAGRMATTRLLELTGAKPVVCQEKERGRYGRVVAVCRASGEDLGAIMVREGLALAFTRYSIEYVDQEMEAKAANRGMHAHDCESPWDFRARNRERKH